MPAFAAIKIHYDHRSYLKAHLKYSKEPRADEYAEYFRLYHEEGVGGNGFHECVNFASGDSDVVKFYLPPTCIPAGSRRADEFVFFSFTYKGDQELPAHIVGIHAGVRLISTEGLVRNDKVSIEGIPDLVYHAEAPAGLVTLITPPLAYDSQDGLYTPIMKSWGYGLRYVDEIHAGNIIRAAIKQVAATVELADESEKTAMVRQLAVLHRISKRYGLAIDESKLDSTRKGHGGEGGMPDQVVGLRGEEFVYERELAYVRSIGQEAKQVEWTSRVVPTSPFDIRTLRKTPNGIREHFLEVKSSSLSEGENVYISSRQIEFFREKGDCATFALVSFSTGDQPSCRELTLEELGAEFYLHPVKYRLARRG